jgi:TnpA family transposase
MATAIHETAYPRIPSSISETDLVKIYTPEKDELEFINKNAKTSSTKLGLTVLLKLFQRLGYFPDFNDVPSQVIEYIGIAAGFKNIKSNLKAYLKMKSRWTHMAIIRSYLNIKAYRNGGRKFMLEAMEKASKVKDIIADIINSAIEEMVSARYELPAFDTFVRNAYDVRTSVNKIFYRNIYDQLNETQKKVIIELLTREESETTSLWDKLKQDPGRPTVRQIREFIKHLNWLKSMNIGSIDLNDIPESKLKRFAEEAKTLNVHKMNEISEHKRFSLAVSLIQAQTGQAYDDLVEMFTRRVSKLHITGKKALEEYKLSHQDIADQLIETLGKIAENWGATKDKDSRIKAVENIFGGNEAEIQKQCEAHLAYSKNNHILFLPQFFKPQRAFFFNLLDLLRPKSTTSDKTLEKAVNFLLKNKYSKSVELSVIEDVKLENGNTETVQVIDLSWIPDKWWRLVTNVHHRNIFVRSVNRTYFELCLFSCISQELRSLDLYVEDADKYSDYNKHLPSPEEYETEIGPFCQQAGFSSDSETFVNHLQSWLQTAITVTDKSFPDNESVAIKNGELILRKIRKKPEPPGFLTIEKLITEKLPELNILDVLSDTEYWLNWTSRFTSVSGFEERMLNPKQRFITTTFCYGCNLGPSQTSRSIDGLDRKQVAYVNQRYINEEKLLNANVEIINQYNNFILPKFWGTGKNASADGTKWDIYEQNLLSEYHIRYGGWGGIGYYHVSDTYIALFSNFISCGVWEAVHILDGLLENKSDIKPDTVHGDTQAQSTPVFALSYLLGIKLMPRIRNLKDLKWYLPSEDFKVKHIGELFTDAIDWQLIKTHLPDMLKVALAVSKGKMRSSIILKKLGTSSRKNKLYFAFRELGRVIRTIFLLNFIVDEGLRRMINAATNISEAWNGFIKWVAFGGQGVISENDREEQRKIIRYNHLVGNLIIFHNVVSMTTIIQDLINEGHIITPEILACLSPYKTNHINRFGIYQFVERIPEPIVKDLKFKKEMMDHSY